MNVAIRADASSHIGVGHVMRCLRLAESLKKRGAHVHFISRAHAGNLIEFVRERGFEVVSLPATAENRAEDVQLLDAEQCIQAMTSARPDWVIVDHYGLDEPWERMVQSWAGCLMTIEDLPHRLHVCSLFLDQNETGCDEAAYARRLPAQCKLAVGPRYALLSTDYASRSEPHQTHDGNVRRILVFFGGTDPYDMTRRAVEALLEPEFHHLEVDVVVGANYSGRAALDGLIRSYTHIRVLEPQSTLADLLARADLAIGAGGTTTWERLCMGVPSLVACIAENQRPTCEQLAKEGVIHYLGIHDRVDSDLISRALREHLRSPERLVSMSELGRRKVDGLGTWRICEALMPTQVEDLRLREARLSDVLLYFDWVNEPEVRRHSLNMDPISLDQHRTWFAARLSSGLSKLFVLLAGELPVGQIRFDFENGEAQLDYSIDRFFRGRGWAKQLVQLGMRALRKPVTVRAGVKRTNLASCAVFERLGFRESVSADPALRLFFADVQ